MQTQRTLKQRFDALLHDAFVDHDSHLYWVVSNGSEPRRPLHFMG